MDQAHAGLYLHIPFCRSKCAYCDFYSCPGFDESLLDRFSAAMQADICRAGNEYSDFCFDSIFIGGGTPTVLGARLADILRTARTRMHTAAGCEVTVEANPESLTPPLASVLAESGVTRVSIGAQSFHDGQLRLLGRIHTAEAAARAAETGRAAGIAYLNLDLMFALPYRPVEQSVQLGLWESSLDRALALGADHISAYSLKLEPGTPLYRRAAAYAFPDEELEEQMYAVLCDKMRRAGLRHYEISNFARPGAECRHNLKYWTGKPYLGLGPAAHSYLRGRRTAAAADTDAYIAAGTVFVECAEIGAAEQAYEHIVTGIRLRQGIAFDRLRAYYDIKQLNAMASELESNGLAERTPRGLALTERGFQVSNAVIALLDGARRG